MESASLEAELIENFLSWGHEGFKACGSHSELSICMGQDLLVTLLPGDSSSAKSVLCLPPSQSLLEYSHLWCLHQFLGY